MDISNQKRESFWREAVALHGSITPHVLPYVFQFGVISAVTLFASSVIEQRFGVRAALQVAPYELAGAALGVLLVLRTNAGYDRWWEGRKLWGGIVNQSRNFAISALAYGPNDPAWREQVVRWAACFPHVARSSLRNEPPPPEVKALLGEKAAASLAKADHMPSFVSRVLAELLREAWERSTMNGFAFLQVDRERASLIDHVGGCERILKSPLPRVYSIKIRRFITLFLLTLPLALVHRIEHTFLIPLITMMVAYPIMSLDQIGIELENPFSTKNLSHLPLEDISATIERNLMAVEKLKDAVGLTEARSTQAGSLSSD
ncbi:MAG: bestrophin family protein [Candidatus Korobacteraceae bacterium]